MTILAAIDFSPVTETVLTALPDLMREGEALHLIHVGEPDPDFIGFDVGEVTVKQQQRNQFRRERETLEGLADRLREQGLEVITEHPHGVISDVILDRASMHGARMIVLGSHGHSALYDLIAGSAAEQVIRKSSVPVLLIPAQSHA